MAALSYLLLVTPPVPLTGLPEAPRVGLPEAPQPAEGSGDNWSTRGPAAGSTRGADSGYGGVTLGPKLAPTGRRRNRVASNACPIRLYPQLARRKSTRQIPLYSQVKVSPAAGLPIVVSHGSAAVATDGYGGVSAAEATDGYGGARAAEATEGSTTAAPPRPLTATAASTPPRPPRDPAAPARGDWVENP